MNELNRLIDQFHVADRGEDKLRRDLKAAAPHAFAKPAPAKPTAVKRAGPPRPTAKVVAVAKSSSADWTEF
jgi:hypothetical protein